MATAYLNPASATTNTNWDGSDVSELAQGETSNIWNSTANSASLDVTLSDFDNTGVASIDSVQVILVGRWGQRSGSWTATTRIHDGTSTYYAEDLTMPASALQQTVAGTVRTTSDGSTAWTDSDLDGMKLWALDTLGSTSTHADLSQMYIKVEYTEVSGYSNDVNGVASANIGKVKGVATASIDKVIGV